MLGSQPPLPNPVKQASVYGTVFDLLSIDGLGEQRVKDHVHIDIRAVVG